MTSIQSLLTMIREGTTNQASRAWNWFKREMKDSWYWIRSFIQEDWCGFHGLWRTAKSFSLMVRDSILGCHNVRKMTGYSRKFWLTMLSAFGTWGIYFLMLIPSIVIEFIAMAMGIGFLIMNLGMCRIADAVDNALTLLDVGANVYDIHDLAVAMTGSVTDRLLELICQIENYFELDMSVSSL